MRTWILFTFLFVLSVSLAFGGGIEAPPSAESVAGLETWIQANISATDVEAEITGAVEAHNASEGTAVHGLGTMSTAAATDYYTKIEMDATLGSISAALDEIIGAP